MTQAQREELKRRVDRRFDSIECAESYQDNMLLYGPDLLAENQRMRELLDDVGRQVGSEYLDHLVIEIEDFLSEHP